MILKGFLYRCTAECPDGDSFIQAPACSRDGRTGALCDSKRESLALQHATVVFDKG